MTCVDSPIDQGSELGGSHWHRPALQHKLGAGRCSVPREVGSSRIITPQNDSLPSRQKKNLTHYRQIRLLYFFFLQKICL